MSEMVMDWYIVRKQSPKNAMYPVIGAVLQQVKEAQKRTKMTPLAYALKFIGKAKNTGQNLAYLKSKNIDLGKEVNAIEIAILAHGERVKELYAKIPNYKQAYPELFGNTPEFDILLDMLNVENSLEKQEIFDAKNFPHLNKLSPEVIAANQVIYDSYLDARNAPVLLTPEARELVKDKSMGLASEFNNFDWGSILDTGIKTGANIVAPGSGALIDKSGISVKGLTGGGAKGNATEKGLTVVLVDQYLKGGAKEGTPVVTTPTSKNWLAGYKKNIEQFTGGIPFETVQDAMLTVDKYNRPFIANGLPAPAYWQELVKEANRLKSSMSKTNTVQPKSESILPTTGSGAGGFNLPEIGNVKWGKDGVSWGVTNNKASMIYLLIGGALLIVLLVLLLRK